MYKYVRGGDKATNNSKIVDLVTDRLLPWGE